MYRRIALICAVLVIMSVFGIMPAFAAPDTVATYDEGTVNDLMAVTKPENQELTTFERVCRVSGYGKEGAVITFYLYSAEEDVYKKMRVNDEDVSVFIGASGLFMKNIDLVTGKNDILMLAEYEDGNYQIIKLNVRAANYNIIEIIKSLTK